MIDKSILPAHWKKVKFAEIIEFLTDYQANGSFASLKENVKYYSEDNYAVLVRLKDLRTKLTTESSFVYTDEHGFNFLKKSQVKEGDILVANVGAGVGTTLVMPKFDRKATLAPNMFRVDLSEAIEGKFFLAFCNSIDFWQQLKLVSAGSGQPKINKAQYRSIEIPLPPLSEQQEIVAKIEELFSELDKGKEQLETAKQQIKVYRQAVLKWAFEGRFTNSEVKESVLPEGWQWVKLGEVSESCLGKMLDKQKNIGSFQPYLRNINVRWNEFDLNDLSKMRFEKKENDRYGIKKGDLIICEGGEPGRAAIWKEQIPNMKIQKALHRVRFYDTTVPNYFLYYLNLIASNKTIEKYFTGTTIKHLTGQSLKKISFPLPPFKEQIQIIQEIESRLSVCNKVEETISKSLQQVETLRQSILKQAFEGKFVKTDTTKTNIEQVQKQANKVSQFQISFN